jgi:hypothetical protein
MSWLPNFLNPWTAALAAAIAIPALLVLYFLKLRRREVDISSTLLWKKAIQDLQVNAPFQKLRRNLLLFLQLLLLALLCLALSRPVSNYTRGAGATNVILIDRSASMSAKEEDGKTRLEVAKKKAKELIDSMGRNSTAMVIAFDDRAEIALPFTADANALRRAIDAIQQTDRPSRLKLAYQLAQAQMAFDPEQLRPGGGVQLPDVWLYSDGRVLDSTEVSIKANLKYERIGSEDRGNIAIVALNAKRNYERPSEVQIFARLANFGPEPVKAQVQMSVEPIDEKGESLSTEVKRVVEVSLPPERWEDADWMKAHAEVTKDETFVRKDSVEFTLDLTTSAVIRVEQMSKDGDSLATDDVARVVVPPPKPLSVLLVTDGNYFLEKAMNSLGLQKPATMIPTSYEAKIPTDFDVIIFDRFSPKKLPPSGNFLYFGCLPDGLKLKIAMQDKDPVTLKDAGVLDWKRDHPILRHLQLGKIFAAEALKLVVPPEAETLLDGLQGPLIVLHHEGRSTHLAVAFDLMQSNWPLKVSFPVFMHNALQYLAVGGDMDLKQSQAPGATPRIPRPNLQKGAASLTELTLRYPKGDAKNLAIPESGDFALPTLNEVGVYSTIPPIPSFERIAVNLLDQSESNLIPADAPPGGIGEAISSTGGRSRVELWWWLIAAAALPLLMIEWWVYTRRVHL